MNYTERHQELNSIFKSDNTFRINDSGTEVHYYHFNSAVCTETHDKDLIEPADESISENLRFTYPVFKPANQSTFNQAILLLHGLNERNWSKYLTWAEYLCTHTGKPVILFPIAFHMNRSPFSWSSPRALQDIVARRRNEYGNDRTMSFANVALSERISEKPLRFYSSGRQSMNDLTQLFAEIKSGKHPLFAENTGIDIFSYSIGSFLSQITVMANPENLFGESKLFMFCGGSIFSSMFGESRSILDRPAFDRLLRFYTSEFTSNTPEINQDNGYRAFCSMIAPERNQEERTSFFRKMNDKIRGISLEKDIVIPYSGVVKAIGSECTKSCIKLIDFPFQYSHENPFPVNSNSNEVNACFNHVFSEAVSFLA